MVYSGRADHLLGYFRMEVLASYQAQPDKFSVHTDYFEGKIESTGTYFAALESADRTAEAIDVRFGFRTLASSELAVVAWMPDLVEKSPAHAPQWNAFRIVEGATAWVPVEVDTRFSLWVRRYLDGDWSVDNGPGAAVAERIACINGLTLEIASERLFDVDEVRVQYPTAENTHRYADAHRELYGILVDGLAKDAIKALAAAAGRAVNCASERTLHCLRKTFPALEEPGFTVPMATVSRQRRLATHKVRPAAVPLPAFDAFTSDLATCVGALDLLLRVLEDDFGVDAELCRQRQDALARLRPFGSTALPAHYGIHRAAAMTGKTVARVEVGEAEGVSRVHRSELIRIRFTDGSVASIVAGSNANGLAPRAGETEINPEDLHVDFIVDWVPPHPPRRPRKW